MIWVTKSNTSAIMRTRRHGINLKALILFSFKQRLFMMKLNWFSLH